MTQRVDFDIVDGGSSVDMQVAGDAEAMDFSVEPAGKGTTDYTELENKPSIEGVTLTGDVSLEDIGAADAEDVQAAQETAEAALTASGKAVRFDAAQTLTDAQKAQARGNIAAADAADVSELKSAIDSTVLKIGITASPIAWESGTINSIGGGVQANAKRIRTNAFNKGDIYSIAPAVGYKIELAAYNSENNNSYVGLWNGSTFVKTAQFDTNEIIMVDLPETYVYKIVLDYTEEIDTSAYTNCIVKYLAYAEKTDIRSEEWDAAYSMAKSLQSGLMPNLQMEKGTIGSEGQRVSSTTVCRTTTAIMYDKDTFIRCSNSDYLFALREYSDSEIIPANFVSYIDTFEGTYRLRAGKYYVITVRKRVEETVDSVETYAKQIEVWSPLYLEAMRKYEFNRFAPFGNTRRKIFAHKGITNHEPENTIPSFEAAGTGGAWGIETDIQATSDGYLICMHDATVDRTTDGTGSIANMTMAEIDQLRIKDYPDLKVPTVEQYLGICKTYGCVPCMELKNVASSQEMIAKLLQTISDYGLESTAVILCSQYSIGYVQCINPKIRCIFIIDPTNLEKWIPKVQRYFNVSVTMASGTYTVTHEIIKQLHDAGLVVNVGGVNTVEEIKGYFAMGADSVSSDFIATY